MPLFFLITGLACFLFSLPPRVGLTFFLRTKQRRRNTDAPKMNYKRRNLRTSVQRRIMLLQIIMLLSARTRTPGPLFTVHFFPVNRRSLCPCRRCTPRCRCNLWVCRNLNLVIRLRLVGLRYRFRTVPPLVTQNLPSQFPLSTVLLFCLSLLRTCWPHRLRHLLLLPPFPLWEPWLCDLHRLQQRLRLQGDPSICDLLWLQQRLCLQTKAELLRLPLIEPTWRQLPLIEPHWRLPLIEPKWRLPLIEPRWWRLPRPPPLPQSVSLLCHHPSPHRALLLLLERHLFSLIAPHRIPVLLRVCTRPMCLCFLRGLQMHLLLCPRLKPSTVTQWRTCRSCACPCRLDIRRQCHHILGFRLCVVLSLRMAHLWMHLV